jgi:DHA1 family multidrug resistance protein-like MFS transporter
MLWLTVTAFFGIGCIAQLVKLFAVDEFGLSEKEFGLLILWPAVIIGILAVPIGWMTDKWGKVRSVRLGFIMCSLSMWSLIVLSSRPSIRDSALIVAGSLLGLGFVVAFPAWMALLTTISKEKSGTIIGAVSTAQGIGVGCGIVVGNWLYSHASKNIHTAHLAPFIASALFLSLATFLSFAIMHRDTVSRKTSAT